MTTGGMPWAGMARLASGSILKADAGVSGSITCLTQTMMFRDINGSYVTGPDGKPKMDIEWAFCNKCSERAFGKSSTIAG